MEGGKTNLDGNKSRENINERVRKIRKSQEVNLTMEKFGERLGVAKSTISNIENGRFSVTEQMIKSICREFNVDYMWLTTGHGEMFVSTDESVLEKIDQIMAGENETHINLIKLAASLDVKELEAIDSIINKYLNIVNKKEI